MKKLVLINPGIGEYTIARQGLKMQPLNLAYIAALTPADWQIKIYDENYSPAQIDSDANLVGITTLTSTVNRAYKLAGEYRKKGIPVVLGGIHASMVPDEAEKNADSVVAGEAESVWTNLLRDFEQGKMKKRYKGELIDFQKPVRPRRDLLSSEYSFGSIQTSRGCPFDCEFCSVKVFNGSKFRQRDVDDVLEELATIPQKMIFFTDDNLVGYSVASRERAKRIFKGMIDKKLNKKWFCQTAINFADDEELLRLAQESGCVIIIVGLESIDPEVLAGSMNKKVNSARGINYYFEFIRRIHKHGITLLGTMIFGNDEAGAAAFNKTTNFLDKSHLDVPWPGLLTPYPGTKLFDRLNSEGRILYQKYPEDWKKYNSTLVISLKTEEANTFFRNFIDFTNKNYSLSAVLRRSLRVLAYSRSWLRTLLVYDFNMSLRRRFKRGLIPVDSGRSMINSAPSK